METLRQRIGLRGALIGASLALFALTSVSADDKGDAITVTDGKRISIEYTLTLSDKTQVDTNVGGQPLIYTQGSQEILPALQKALVGLKAGETKHVTLSAEDGYGSVDPKAFQEVDKNVVPEDGRKAGTQLMARDPSGRSRPVRVHEIKENTIVLDLNHPLAGQTLVFDVKILKVEEAAP